ncbi:fasciclin domain-containing protein [Alteromonas sp. ASW11-36]|uniref:Fasciclin domain-containing protein n=2 Tax=Alteromonas arenosi TaxID=3055817 RepID=A0ABT7SZ86_9ALTE|nr:fasciclin domain-containing protein [Alteromonas sp. ASW11-36]MDM7861501.1 fasciclin domain-containing protein [Alteromonas sp. ASW11-36]
MKKLLSTLLLSTALFGVSTAVVAGGNYKQKSHQQPSIVAIAANNPDFSTLVAALKAADLVEALQGDGPFTVFAPTNAAFAKLPAGTVESLLKPENKHQLIDILTYHVVPGAVYAKDVVSIDTANSLQGDSIDVNVTMGRVTVDNANVVATDIKGSNGVIHVIDSVILPNS